MAKGDIYIEDEVNGRAIFKIAEWRDIQPLLVRRKGDGIEIAGVKVA